MITGLWVKAEGEFILAYPYSPVTLRSENPDTSYPAENTVEWLEREGVFVVAVTQQPAHHPSKIITEGQPILVDGVWTQQWVETDAELPTQEELQEYAKKLRKQKELGGITFMGVPLETDEVSQTKILGARVAANANPQWSTVWSGADGGSYPLNAQMIIGISDAVLNHVSGCFETYAGVLGDIRDGVVSTYAHVEEAFA